MRVLLLLLIVASVAALVVSFVAGTWRERQAGPAQAWAAGCAVSLFALLLGALATWTLVEVFSG